MRNDGAMTVKPVLRGHYEAIEVNDFGGEHWYDVIAFVKAMRGKCRISRGAYWGDEAAVLRYEEHGSQERESVVFRRGHVIVTLDGYFHEVITDWEFARNYTQIEEEK